MKTKTKARRQNKWRKTFGDIPASELFPWKLSFDRDGTEDLAVIYDSHGDILATSREFWYPEDGDPIVPTLSSVWLMFAAPELQAALQNLLAAIDELPANALPCACKSAMAEARSAIASSRRGPGKWDLISHRVR